MVSFWLGCRPLAELYSRCVDAIYRTMVLVDTLVLDVSNARQLDRQDYRSCSSRREPSLAVISLVLGVRGEPEVAPRGHSHELREAVGLILGKL